jgi:hypothetical protein
MTSQSKLFCGILLLTVPAIQYGGYFLLTILTGKTNLPLTDFQKSMFRAGHAHAGVFVILALLVQILIDDAGFSKPLELTVRISFALSALLISGGFFAAAVGKNITKPTPLISILHIGIAVLATSLITLGIALINNSAT